MKRWMKWVLEGAAIYGALVLLMALLWQGSGSQPKKSVTEIKAMEEAEEPVIKEEEEDPQPDFFTLQVHYRDFGITTGSNAEGGFEWTGPGQHSTCVLHYKKCNVNSPRQPFSRSAAARRRRSW